MNTHDTRPSPAATAPTWQPAVDVLEDATGVTLYADLPGVAREQLALQVQGEQLAIEASAQLPAPLGAVRYLRRFMLGRTLDTAQLSAELSHGVLRVRIPRAAQALPRRIEVAAA